MSKTCDQSNKELIIPSAYPTNYALELKVVNTRINTSDMQYCISMFPPFEGTKHFCDKTCLREWLKDN